MLSSNLVNISEEVWGFGAAKESCVNLHNAVVRTAVPLYTPYPPKRCCVPWLRPEDSYLEDTDIRRVIHGYNINRFRV